MRAFYPDNPVMIVLLDILVKHGCVSGEDLRGDNGVMELEPSAVAAALQTLHKEKLIKKTMLVDPSKDLEANRRVEFWYMDYRTVRSRRRARRLWPASPGASPRANGPSPLPTGSLSTPSATRSTLCARSFKKKPRRQVL